MELKDIYQLIETFNASTLTHLDITHEETHIKLKREVMQQAVMPQQNQILEQPVVVAPQTNEVPEPTGTIVTSPLVGVFYAAPSPQDEVFVKKGDTVEKGQILCVVEAMKTMNEIVAPAAGKISEIFAENEQIVAFETPLFEIKE